jgi:hypothetical protein
VRRQAAAGDQRGELAADVGPDRLGVAPAVVPSILTEGQNPVDRFDSHWGTDLQDLRKLA